VHETPNCAHEHRKSCVQNAHGAGWSGHGLVQRSPSFPRRGMAFASSGLGGDRHGDGRTEKKKMNEQASMAASQTTAESTIRFRRDQFSSGISRIGHPRPGGELRVEYDPSRLIDADVGPSASVEIVCHARFQPTGQEHSADLQFPSTATRRAQGIPRPGLFHTRIPEQTTLVELWFERRGAAGTDGWDSRYGLNYRFPVGREGLPVPEQSVALRPEAIIDPSRIHVVDDAAAKAQASSSSGFALRTDLRLSAEITRPTQFTTAWADTHVFDATGELIHRDTLELHRPEAVSAETLTHTWSASVYQGSGGGSGTGVWSRPDAHSVQYRLYCQMGEQVFTDGVLHQFDLPADSEVRPIAGSW
jgi:Family of unknown function (DUF6209)